MADSLLSQADVDALVASLTRNDPPKPAAAPPAPKPVAAAPAPAPAPKAAPVLVKPVPAPAPAAKPVTDPAPAKPAPSGFSTTKPEPINTNFKGTSIPASRASESAIPKVMPSGRIEPKAEVVSNEVVNGLNAKIAELTKQLNQISGAIKRLDGFEKKLGDLTARVENNRESAQTAQKVQILNDELKKIALNLKGTPGYGIKNSFDCEKCSDHGHVAVMFRCTSCGHERWYGWWPGK